ncbi:MAG: hypothetical protein JJU00_19655, partial [Opitutales bacterium]|nr:hypothetical protein [Opitutales bacterium]
IAALPSEFGNFQVYAYRKGRERRLYGRAASLRGKGGEGSPPFDFAQVLEPVERHSMAGFPRTMQDLTERY